MPKSDTTRRKAASGGFNFTHYFIVIMVFFLLTSIVMNIHVSKETATSLGGVQEYLRDSFTSYSSQALMQAAGFVAPDTTAEEMAENNSDTTNDSKGKHTLAGLHCDKYGGPSQEAAKEMVYWEDIPSDARHFSPFHKRQGPTQYLTFEPDEGGWNNIRMSMETVLAMAFAMGRTLVLPPEQTFYLLGKNKGKRGEQRNNFGFNHFFHMESIHEEHPGLDVITMKEFLEREAMTGSLKDQQGNVVFPPGNQTDWDGKNRKPLYNFLRATGHMALWDPNTCMAAFPSSPDPKDTQALIDMKESVEQNGGFASYEAYVGKPFPVDAPPVDRMKENWADRKKLCLYDNILQETQLIHFPTDRSLDARLLVQ